MQRSNLTSQKTMLGARPHSSGLEWPAQTLAARLLQIQCPRKLDPLAVMALIPQCCSSTDGHLNHFFSQQGLCQLGGYLP